MREDGVGTAPKALAATRRWGVMGLCERAAHFGERVGIETAPGRGTTARLVLPDLPLDQPPERPAAPDRRAS